MSLRRDPLLSHPLAATANAPAEPTLRTAFASVSPPQSPPPPSPSDPSASRPPIPASPRSVLSEVPFISRRRSALASPPRVIRSSPGADDPLSGALRALGPSAVARPPAADAAYATSISTLLIRERSMDNSGTIGNIHQHGATALISSHVTNNDAIAKGQVTEIQLRAGNTAGMFVIETWREPGDNDNDIDTDMDTRSRKSAGILSSAASSTGASECVQVMRSIADFVWLEGRLRAKYDGVIVPHLPPMALKGRLLYGFAYETERLRGLHRFVSLLVSHPLLAHVDETLAFLGDRGTRIWKAVRRRPLEHTRTFVAVQNDENAGTGGIIRQWGAFRVWQAGRRINRGVGSFLNRDASNNNNAQDLSAEEKALERLQSYVRDLRISLHETRNAAKEAAEASAHCRHKYADIQRTLRSFGTKEGGVFGDLLRTITLVANEEANLGGNLNDVRSEEDGSSVPGGGIHDSGRTADQRLDDVLMDYETRAVSAARLVQLRCDEREAYEYAVENYSSLRQRWEQSTSSVWDNSNNNNEVDTDTSDLRELHSQLATAADTLAKAQRQYQLVDRSTNDELRRLRTHLHGELLRALREVAAERATQHTQMRDAWQQLTVRIDETNSADQTP